MVEEYRHDVARRLIGVQNGQRRRLIDILKLSLSLVLSMSYSALLCEVKSHNQ